ncbi:MULTISPECIES: histidinol-phosphatase HisJ family protein [Caproicibacterium]|uniref:Histidinol-phosphatase n=1 Tax=Caproicibacterium argilliputei TaxID=3030016 RepID=A0AA97H3J4_9FIRM|nr:histidinol-phosphatase HisJ family protein [Caproicibacterium argilliputei]WOC33287.1 histidinol-phosphatase HisJ family protein [Caproicibacterium argilliputei]
MRYRYLSDSHCHTDCSFDGRDSAMMLCDSAVRQGLFSLTVTDHCECNEYWEKGYDRAMLQSYFEARKAAAAFRGRLHVRAGIELGQPLQDRAAAENALSLCDYDFVLASLHNVAGAPDFYDLDYATCDIRALLHRYFEEMLEMVRWGKFDSLAHLTYPWRYTGGEHNDLRISYEPYRQQIDAVLQELIRQDKCLEVNTSGLRQRIGTTLPDRPILQRYRELGGRLVTLGSDAHRWGDVGSGIEDGLRLLEQLGFSRFAVYTGRRPELYPIS